MNEHIIQLRKKNSWDDTLRTLVIALVIAMTFRSLAYEPFHIPSGSMKPTLLIGDYLFVSKYSYGYSRYSFPFGLPFFQGRIFETSKPKRGDVVVFREPSDTHIDFIKRVIGLPGDSIQLKDGIVYINGSPLKRQLVDEFPDNEGGETPRMIPRFSETLPDGKIITILKERRYGLMDDTQVYKVPPGHYFMMGDNRDNSQDSRFLENVGYVPEENIIGRAEIIFFSVDGTLKLLNPVSWITSLRFDRFFKRIE